MSCALYLFLCETNLAHDEEDVLSGKQCGGHCGEDAQEEGGQRGGEEEHVQPGEVRGGTHHTGHTLEYKENIFLSLQADFHTLCGTNQHFNCQLCISKDP